MPSGFEKTHSLLPAPEVGDGILPVAMGAAASASDISTPLAVSLEADSPSSDTLSAALASWSSPSSLPSPSMEGFDYAAEDDPERIKARGFSEQHIMW